MTNSNENLNHRMTINTDSSARHSTERANDPIYVKMNTDNDFTDLLITRVPGRLGFQAVQSTTAAGLPVLIRDLCEVAVAVLGVIDLDVQDASTGRMVRTKNVDATWL